ncbi:histidine phosphatase family protein [Actinomadura sp. 6N118]|uniref:histidine phosphatase family protein n=1 Tax=Actinomadura sp. 6N118 TaxID=3375151 RepID=UPI0037992B5E
MGPSLIMAVRHGESAVNAAYTEASRTNAAVAFPGGNADVPLTELGRAQAAAVGRWLGGLPAQRRPQVVWCSPYQRTMETWRIAGEQIGRMGEPVPETRMDQRLIDRVMGELELMNPQAIGERFPEEARRCKEVGEHAYRPPGGESFGDVAARLRALASDLNGDADASRVLIVAHNAVVTVLRHVLEADDDTDMTGIAAFGPVANASVSTWERRRQRLTLAEFSAIGHLRHGKAVPTW